MNDSAPAAAPDATGGDPEPERPPLTLDRLRELNPKWAVEQRSSGVHCKWGAFRVLAADPDDAEFEIALREQRAPSPEATRRPAGPYPPGTFGHLMRSLSSGGT